MTQNTFMEQAIINAYKGLDLGEVPVGCVIVNQNNKIISQSYNKVIADNDPTAHAEINAIRQACVSLESERLVDCSIYVTLEPCIMCAAALVQARMGNVIYGAYDKKRGGLGGTIDLSKHESSHHKMNVVGGILESDCKNKIKIWFRKLRNQK